MTNRTMRACSLAALLALAACGSDADGGTGPTDEAGPPPGGAAPGVSPPATPPPPPPEAISPGVRVWFKLDPRITQSIYMGERWVSPPSYATAQEGPHFVVEARARLIDAAGTASDVEAAWTPSDPRMVAVSQRRAHHVEWTVRLEGRSTVAVRHGAETRLLTVVAVRDGAAWRVEISQ